MIPTTLTCKECGHTNESQRIYCHNCGVKLDRSILPPEETLEETQESVRKRVSTLVTPESGFWAGSWQSALQTVVWSVVAAVLVQICRPPDDVPPIPKKGEFFEKPMITMLMNRAMTEPTPQRIAIQENIANNYLLSTLKPRETGLVDKELKFVRAFAQFKPGLCAITSEQSLFDFSIFARVLYQLQIADNKINAVCVGGSLGRMPIHPVIMGYANVAFQSLWDLLSKERKLIDQMQSIDIKEKEIVFETKPGRH